MQTFARAGVVVTLVFCGRRLLPEAEPEIGQALADYPMMGGDHTRRDLRFYPQETRTAARSRSLEMTALRY